MPRSHPPGDYLVVLTACVDPSTGPAKMARADPVVRLGDYLDGLRFWLELPDPRLDRILLLENSGHPLTAFDDLFARHNPHGKAFEAISMRCNDYPPHLDYGYAELHMLDDGLAASRLARLTRYWMKATGRLTFPNVSRLLDRLPRDYRFAVDCKRATRLVGPEMPWVHTWLILFAGEFYDAHLRGARHDMTAGRPIEMLLHERFARFEGEPGAIRRWPVHVPPRGVGGLSGTRFDSPARRSLDAFRAAARVVAPHWWI